MYFPVVSNSALPKREPGLYFVSGCGVVEAFADEEGVLVFWGREDQDTLQRELFELPTTAAPHISWRTSSCGSTLAGVSSPTNAPGTHATASRAQEDDSYGAQKLPGTVWNPKLRAFISQIEYRNIRDTLSDLRNNSTN